MAVARPSARAVRCWPSVDSSALDAPAFGAHLIDLRLQGGGLLLSLHLPGLDLAQRVLALGQPRLQVIAADTRLGQGVVSGQQPQQNEGDGQDTGHRRQPDPSRAVARRQDIQVERLGVDHHHFLPRRLSARPTLAR